MGEFDQIDNKLQDFADKINATLTKNRPGLPEGWIISEKRRIDWADDQIKKSIIIQRASAVESSNPEPWTFINVAWIERDGVAVKPGWIKRLVDKGSFHDIEDHIDGLLISSEMNLTNIRIEDVE